MQQWALLSKCWLLFVLALHTQLCGAFTFNQHTVAQIPCWSSAVIGSQAGLARNESQWQTFRCTCLAYSSFCFQDCSSKEELCVVSPFWMFILVINVKEDLLEVRVSVSSGGDFLSALTCCQRYLLEELCLPVWNLCFLKGFAVFKIQKISLRRKWK